MSNFYLQFAAESAEEASGLAALGLDLRTFIVQLATFVLVFLVLRKYVFSHIVTALENRRKTIEQGLQLTSELSEEKKKLDQEVAEAHKKARKESDEIIAASRVRADVIVKEAEDKAQAKVDIMFDDARKKTVEETRRARHNLEKEMVDLVIYATEFVAKEKIDAKKDKQLIDEALEGQK